MRKCLKAVIAALSLCFAFSCLNLAVAQIRTGGYKEISRDNPEVEAAAKFAVEEHGRKQEASFTLVSIEKAESQVVAGINYKLCLKVSTEGDDEPKETQAIVYRNLKKEYSLTSWEETNCGESGSEGNHVSSLTSAKNSTPPDVSIGGVYENFTVGKGSGDLEGMRVVIVAAGGAYHAIVQTAQGGAEDPKPEFVDVTVKGRTVSFSGLTGTVTAAGLSIKTSDGTIELLKRKSCSEYFSMKP